MKIMKTIIVASRNPVKLEAVRSGFNRMFNQEDFQIKTVSVPSGVKEQPSNNHETITGAFNRTKKAAELFPNADFWIGIEGGVEENDDELAAFAWIVVRSKELVGKARTGTFFLPPPVVKLIKEGKELGEADDIVFNRSDSKKENGAVGILTDNSIDRKQLYEHGVVLALIPFKNKDLFSGK